MATKLVPVEPENLACKICLEEIPESVHHSHEADEYALHYCGIECYSLWKSESSTDKEQD